MIIVSFFFVPEVYLKNRPNAMFNSIKLDFVNGVEASQDGPPRDVTRAIRHKSINYNMLILGWRHRADGISIAVFVARIFFGADFIDEKTERLGRG